MRKVLVLTFLFLVAALCALGQTTQNPLQVNLSASDSGSCATANACAWQYLTLSAGQTVITLSGTFSGTFIVELTNNGTTWTTSATLTSAGTTTYAVSGYTAIRVRCSAYTSGTAIVNLSTGTASGGGGGTSKTNGSIGAVFNVLNYGWIDDDSTDNCGTPVTTFLADVNGYSGPGIAQVLIPEGAAGKAYKLTTCSLTFTKPRTIYLWGTIDCAQTVVAALPNCIQEGPSGLGAFSNAQTPPYTIEGTGVINGCLNVTVACIEAMLYVSNPRVVGIHLANVGAGNASPPACTNYSISFDGNNNAPQILDTEYWNTDGVTGRCWSINNRTGAGGGTNSALIEHNTIIGAGAAPGFTTPCGSIGHSELGSATIVKGNQFYGFGIPLLLSYPQFGAMISSNQFDQAGCTTGVTTADIQYGDAGNHTVNLASIFGNYFPGGAGHAASAIALATGSSSALQNFVFANNEASGSSVKNIFPSATPPTCTGDCELLDNINFAPSSASVYWPTAAGAGAAGTSAVAQTANVAPTTAFTTANASVYRATCYVVLTTAAATSSTLPSCSIKYTDFQTSVVGTLRASITWAAGASCTGAATNTVGNSCSGSVIFAAKGATAIQFCTGATGCDTNGTDYASNSAATMQYTAFARVERLN